MSNEDDQQHSYCFRSIPQYAIDALAELLLDISQHEPCEPGCIRCGNEPSHTAEDGQLYCELCRGCNVDALKAAD